MKIATAAYPLDPLTNWAEYAAKIESWVSDAAGNGADLLVFPEYGAMELVHARWRRSGRRSRTLIALGLG